MRESSGTVATSGMPIIHAVASLRPAIESSPVLRTRVNTDDSDMNQQGLSNQSTIDHTGLWNPTWCPQISTSVSNLSKTEKALKQVVASPKVEYMFFDRNPVKFTSFMHNFQTCLEKNNNNEASKLQLLIQEHGKAKEAIVCKFVCRTRVPCSNGNSERELC